MLYPYIKSMSFCSEPILIARISIAVSSRLPVPCNFFFQYCLHLSNSVNITTLNLVWPSLSILQGIRMGQKMVEYDLSKTVEVYDDVRVKFYHKTSVRVGISIFLFFFCFVFF